MRQTLGEELTLDIPWQPDAVIAYKFILCDHCKYRRTISVNYHNKCCENCVKKTYNWSRSPALRQGELD
jgi:hypothetical protein